MGTKSFGAKSYGQSYGQKLWPSSAKEKSPSAPKALPFSIAPVLRRLNGAKIAIQHLLYLMEDPILPFAFQHS